MDPTVSVSSYRRRRAIKEMFRFNRLISTTATSLAQHSPWCTVLGAQSLMHSPWCTVLDAVFGMDLYIIHGPWSAVLLASSPTSWKMQNGVLSTRSRLPFQLLPLSLSLSSSVPSVFFRIHNCFTGVVCPKMIILGVSMYGSAMFG